MNESKLLTGKVNEVTVREAIQAKPRQGEAKPITLTEQQQCIVDYMVAGELSVREIAEAMDVNVSNVYRTLRMAKIQQCVREGLLGRVQNLEGVALSRCGDLIKSAELSEVVALLNALSKRTPQVKHGESEKGKAVYVNIVMPNQT